jgi:hypothetical protein
MRRGKRSKKQGKRSSNMRRGGEKRGQSNMRRGGGGRGQSNTRRRKRLSNIRRGKRQAT